MGPLKGRSRQSIDWDKVAALTDEGKTPFEIAITLKCALPSVYYILRSLGKQPAFVTKAELARLAVEEGDHGSTENNA